MTLSHSFYRWIDDNSVLLCTIKVITICYGNFRDDFINCLPLETFESMIKLGGGGAGNSHIKGRGCSLYILGLKKKRSFVSLMVFSLKRSTPEAFVARFRVLSRKKDDER